MPLDSPTRHDDTRQREHDDCDESRERRALIEQARRLGATATELESALDALALQAEAVLHRLRGGRLH